MPRDGAGALLEEGLVAAVAGAAVHEVNLGMSGRRATGRVDVVTAKVATKFEGLFDGQVGKVLGAEGDDLALGHEARELVLAGVVETAQLDA